MVSEVLRLRQERRARALKAMTHDPLERPFEALRLQRQGLTLKEIGASPTVKHLTRFFESVRSGKPTAEGVIDGHRAAACAHLVNDSARRDKVIEWDFAKDLPKG